jgi:hypothetical protein
MFVVGRPKSHRRIQLDADKSTCELGRLADSDVIHLDGATHDRHWVPIWGAAPIIVVERLSQRIEADETVYAWTILPAGDPRHHVDLILDAQLIVVLEPLGEIDDRGRHQQDARLLRDLAVKLIEFLR